MIGGFSSFALKSVSIPNPKPKKLMMDYLMEVKDQMSAIGDLEPLLPSNQTLGLVLGQLLKEVGRVNDDAVADERDAVGPDDARRQQVEVVLLVAHDDGVSGVVAALTAGHDIGVLGQQIHQLALALVAPLGAQHHRHAVGGGGAVGSVGSGHVTYQVVVNAEREFTT